MTQNHLWIETWADAVRALIEACGGPKRVGAELRPDLPADDAGEWLLRGHLVEEGKSGGLRFYINQ